MKRSSGMPITEQTRHTIKLNVSEEGGCVTEQPADVLQEHNDVPERNFEGNMVHVA